MALQKITHIEGLDAYQDVELRNDDDPGAMRVWFEIRAIDDVAETIKQGKPVRKNWVYIFKSMELGHSELGRRIKDKVSFDETTNRWKVDALADEIHSDILKYPAEWNIFATGAKYEDVGTPLSVLFKTDPARVLMYKDKHITTVERLAGMNKTDSDNFGMGVGDDVQRAKNYLAKLNAQANNGATVISKLEDQSHEISVLQRTIQELQAKLNEVEQPEAPVKRGRGRPKKSESFNEESFAP